MINLIVAMDINNGIGKDNKLLCTLKDDMKHFKDTTEGHVVVMGRKTFESIGKPLPNRDNIVLTRHPNQLLVDDENVLKIWNSDVLLQMNKMYPSKPIFIIGGAEIYEQFFPYASRIYLTRILHEFEADSFFPNINILEDFHIREQQYHEADERNEHAFLTCILDRKIPVE